MTPGVAARAGALAVIGAALVWASPATAQEGSCRGVTVVVDFGEAGPESSADSEPAVGCAEDPSNGIEALTQAGFTVTEVISFPGAVCRIDGFPDDECGLMPPADRSWSYWRAVDGEWTYSNVGAGTADPDDGDVEGWVFGGGSQPPGVAPASARAAESAPADTAESSNGSPTWVIAVVLLSVIAGLVIWRLRRGRAT
ncbi:hypothetical protein GCM10027447_16420 [Glycomyces halotolerans]